MNESSNRFSIDYDDPSQPEHGRRATDAVRNLGKNMRDTQEKIESLNWAILAECDEMNREIDKTADRGEMIFVGIGVVVLAAVICWLWYLAGV